MLMMRSLPSGSAVSPQMEREHGFWFGKLSIEWWERPLLANTGKSGEKQLVDDTINVGLEWQRRQAGYIDIANQKGTDQILGRTVRK